jgi:TonB family protein
MPFYPAEARRLGLTGRVGLECSIDMNGHPQNITVVDPSGSLLDKHAVQLLSIGHFTLPEDWLMTGGPETRYRIGITFELSNKAPVPQFLDGHRTINVKSTGIP